MINDYIAQHANSYGNQFKVIVSIIIFIVAVIYCPFMNVPVRNVPVRNVNAENKIQYNLLLFK